MKSYRKNVERELKIIFIEMAYYILIKSNSYRCTLIYLFADCYNKMLPFEKLE